MAISPEQQTPRAPGCNGIPLYALDCRGGNTPQMAHAAGARQEILAMPVIPGNASHSWRCRSFLAMPVIPGDAGHSWQCQSFLAMPVILSAAKNLGGSAGASQILRCTQNDRIPTFSPCG
jgi:hypothetical protein